jgi:predicted nucleic acid-binding protein
VRYRYWDACVFLGWLKAEPDKLAACQAGIRMAERGELTIITSVLSLAEVLRLKGNDPIPVADREAVRAFFENDYISLYEVDRTIAEKAQDVVWNHGVRPKDAIHVATALSTATTITIEQFDTFDTGLIALNGQIGAPALTIGLPNLPEAMF